MKKDSHQEAVRKGIEQLRQWGVETEGLSSPAVGLFASYLGKGRETDLAVIFLLGRIADHAALEVLTSLEKTATDKEIKKEVRRSLFKLAQRGISAPRSEAIAVTPQRPILKLAPEIEGYLSSVDGAGGRLVWLAKPQAGSGIQLLQGMFSDREGLVRVAGALIRRKELRRMAQGIKEKHGVIMISIPWEYGDQILYEEFEKAKASGQSGMEQFPSLRAIFNPAKPKPAPHPIYNRLSQDEVRSGAWRDLSRRLLDEPEFRLWVLDEDWVKPYLEQVQEAQESRLVLNQLQKEERFAAIVRDAVTEIFSGDKGKLFSRRMEDMTLYLLETKREQQAKLALALALQLKEGDLGMLDISFLTGLVQKSLAFYLSQAKEKAAEEPSLIVKP
ncbi:MAG: hypothetical protein HY694_03270 [Deltaproteobacteria bacterium]|nr:hypothetical protein [Deltaproteobacteria bacterium]